MRNVLKQNNLLSVLIICMIVVFALPATSLAAAVAWESQQTTASMSVNLQLVKAVTMQDGKIMAIGGNTGTVHLATTEIYNPTANNWSSGPSMNTARFSHAAATLKDGRVMVIGGNSFDTGALATTEILDPQTNTWSNAAPLPEPRASAQAVTLPDGKVLVIGGGNDNGDLSSTAIYDPAANSWTAGASLSKSIKEFGAVLLQDGTVLVMGGTVGVMMSSSSQIYDPNTNSWTTAASMPQMRYVHAAAVAEDGRVYVAGGFDSNYSPLTSTFYYDPETNVWSTGPNTSVGLLGHDVAVLPDGRILMVGGTGNSGPTKVSSLYQPKLRTHKPKASVPGGEIASGTAVTLTTATNGGVIHYTTDGNAPTGSSTVYTGPITVSSPTTIKAVTVKSGWDIGLTMSESYTVKEAAVTALSSSANPSMAGQAVTLTAMVSGSGAAPTGTVNFVIDGGTPVTVALDASGQASMTTSSLTVGNHSITAAYNGEDASFAGSTSAAQSHTVSQATTAVTLASSSSSATYGGNVTLTQR